MPNNGLGEIEIAAMFAADVYVYRIVALCEYCVSEENRRLY
jgi:hypothetical protein